MLDVRVPGAEIEKPLAIVVVGGLVTRPIKIVILPMVYEWVERRAERRAARRAEPTAA
jgi:cobalt-zinc-cadmium resistance protein CzcA